MLVLVLALFGASLFADKEESIKNISYSELINLVNKQEIASVTLIGENAFSGCEQLTSLFVQGSRVSCQTMTWSSQLTDLCVSPDYQSNTFCGQSVTSSTDNCKNYRSFFNHCYEGNYNESGFVIEKRKNATEWESKAYGCVEYTCYNSSGQYIHRECGEPPECYSNGVCDESNGECTYKKIEGCVPKSDHSDPYTSNGAHSDSKSNLVWIYAGVIPAGVLAFVIIILFATPLRNKIFGACKSKNGNVDNYDINNNYSTTKELTMTLNGEEVNLLLERTIGKGSFGTVWLAKRDDGSTFAVKEMQRQIDGNDCDYKKELGIMSELHSDYIVGVYGSLVTDELFYMAMEYVPLGSLSTAYKEYILSAYMRCRFMLDVARGMKYLHGQGIIHRDLKPRNVLVSSLDPKSNVLCKITDFGESRQGLEQTETMTMTCGIGSPYYMAPEMLRGDKNYSRAVDVFSFSILCVELWNEDLPYSETHFDSHYAFVLTVLNGNRPKIKEGCPKRLTKLIAKCWTEERQERPPFDVIVDKLEHITETVTKEEVDVKPRQDAKTHHGEGVETKTRSNNIVDGDELEGDNAIPLDDFTRY